MYTTSDGAPFIAPNDLVFDDTGNFWFTDMRGHTIHYASPDGSSIRTVLKYLHTPNGIGLAPDGSVLYWAQTQTRQVLRRHIEADDVGAAAAYLLSDDARNVTGTTVYVDAGYHAMGM